jgi:hypothetical protein
MVDTVVVENDSAPASAVSWPAVFAGAVVMIALSMALLALGNGIGFSVVNPRSHASAADTIKAATVAGIYLTATAILASAVGGYLRWPASLSLAGYPSTRGLLPRHGPRPDGMGGRGRGRRRDPGVGGNDSYRWSGQRSGRSSDQPSRLRRPPAASQ